MKISLITICYNAKDTIEKTILSVINQTALDNVEYIIIDGNSTDGTKEIIEKYKDKISIYISEPDSGIYNAMNKGVEVASGDYIHFLNANDCYCASDVIERVLEVAIENNTDFVIGDVVLLPNQGEEIYRSFKHLTRFTLFMDWMYHVALFQKKELFKKFGNFDENFKISSDANWFIPLLQDNEVTKSYVEAPIARFALDGVSAQEETRDITVFELEKVLSINFTGRDDFYRRILQDSAFNKFSSKPVKKLNKFINKLKLKPFIIKQLLKKENWLINYRNKGG
jgi:glycosyltransferase involved in cell wall biosynthesis